LRCCHRPQPSMSPQCPVDRQIQNVQIVRRFIYSRDNATATLCARLTAVPSDDRDRAVGA
jgi:hypothetical protein